MENSDKPPSSQGWLGRLAARLSPTPENREQLEQVLQKSHESHIIDSDALQIMAGALRVGDQRAQDILVPRAQMRCLGLGAALDEVLALITESGHSRFPVFGDGLDDLRGILLAKDLIAPLAAAETKPDLAALLRPATVISPSKRLGELLKEFRERRYHMAVVIDKYGSVTGLVTIEDILEEIVGDIEDETDEQEADSIQLMPGTPARYQIEAQTAIGEFNQYFQANLQEGEYDTLGGLVMGLLGHLPAVGETVDINGFRLAVLEADNRRIIRLAVTRQHPEPASDPDQK